MSFRLVGLRDLVVYFVSSMEEVIKTGPKRSEYCPISVSDMATNSAKVRQNSLREYSHAKNAAYRTFCRAPGRPQTAAFGRVYGETRLVRRSRSPSKAGLRECVVASKASMQEPGDTTTSNRAATAFSRTSRPVYGAERRLLTRAKTMRTTLPSTPPKKLLDKQTVKVSGIGRTLEEIFVNDNTETGDLLVDLDFSSNEKRSDTEISGELNRVSDDIGKQLTVYHSVENGCSCTASVSFHGPLSCSVCSCDRQSLVSSYSVKIQGEGHQSTPGLGHCYSQENRALWDLLEKQLSLVCK